MNLEQIKENINARLDTLYSKDIDQFIADLYLPAFKGQYNEDTWNVNLERTRELFKILATLESYKLGLIASIERTQLEHKLEVIKLISEIEDIKASLAQQDANYKLLLPLVGSPILLPILSTTFIPFKHITIGKRTTAVYGTNDPLLVNTELKNIGTESLSIYFESEATEECIVSLNFSFDEKIINAIEVLFDETVDTLAPIVSDLDINGYDVTFIQIGNMLYFAPIVATNLFITMKQTDIWTNSLNVQKKICAITNISFLANQYSDTDTFAIEKVLPQNHVCQLVFSIEPFSYEAYTITGSVNGFDLSTSVVDLIDLNASITLTKDKVLLAGIKDFYKEKSERINDSFFIQKDDITETIYLSNSSLDTPFLYETALIGRSLDESYALGRGQGTPIRFGLPFTLSQEEALRTNVTVNNITWNYVEELSASGPTDTVWTVEKNRYITFGDDLNGQAPSLDSEIKMRMDLKQPTIQLIDGKYHLIPNELFEPDTNNIDVYVTQQTSKTFKKVLSRAYKVFSLHENIKDDSFRHVSISKSGPLYTPSTLLTEQTFVNGSSELTVAGDFSIDYINGFLYLYDYIQPDEVVTISYEYYPTSKIDVSNLAIHYEDNVPVSIKTTSLPVSKIEEEIGTTYSIVHPIENESVDNDVADIYAYQLMTKSIIQGSVNVSGFFVEAAIEVPYINGYYELLGLKEITNEKSPAFSGIGVKEFSLQNPTIFYSPASVHFKNGDIFETKVTNVGLVLTEGDYHIADDGTVTFYSTEAIVKPQKYSYYAYDININTDFVYSVDYLNGIIYSLAPLQTEATISYTTANVWLGYKLISKLRFTQSDKRIELHTRQLFHRHAHVRAAYTKAETGVDLAPYYTPIIKKIFAGLN